MKYIIDIETSPLSEPEILKYAEDLKPDSRLKDPVKVAEDLKNKKDKLVTCAPLSALTGKICGFGILDTATGKISTSCGLDAAYELTAIESFMALLQTGNTLITFNGLRFDLPYLCRRALLYNKVLFNRFFKLDGYPQPNSEVSHIDLALVWDCKCREYVSLAKLATFLQVGEKKEVGTFFYQQLEAGKEEEAKSYLANDLKLTWEVAKKFGVA
jgi:predicted PolB exonuclease-like 3'-5' exonuclease